MTAVIGLFLVKVPARVRPVSAPAAKMIRLDVGLGERRTGQKQQPGVFTYVHAAANAQRSGLAGADPMRPQWGTTTVAPNPFGGWTVTNPMDYGPR